jgi:hypothetical protein
MEFFQAALHFMDEQGIALSRVKRKPNGSAGPSVEVLRETVKRRYTTRRSPAKRDVMPAPTGDNLSMKEAAQILKVSDASVRNFVEAGKLSLAGTEKRTMKNGVTHKVQVLRREDVEQFATVYKPNKRIQAVTRRKRPAGKKKT